MNTHDSYKALEPLQSLSQDQLMTKIRSSPVPVKNQIKIGLVCMGTGLFYLVIDTVCSEMSPGSSCAHGTMVYVCMGIILMTMNAQLYSTNAKLAALTELVKRERMSKSED